MVATCLPSICRLKARFHPNCGTLFKLRDQVDNSLAPHCWLKLHTQKQGSEEPCCRRCVLISLLTLRLRLVFRQPRISAKRRQFNPYRKTTVVIPKDTMRSLAKRLAGRRCCREKCCVQLF